MVPRPLIVRLDLAAEELGTRLVVTILEGMRPVSRGATRVNRIRQAELPSRAARRLAVGPAKIRFPARPPPPHAVSAARIAMVR
jgi:hypothetical protein